MESTFRCNIKKGSLTATADVSPTFGKFSLIVEQLLNHREIDGDDPTCLEDSVSAPEDAVSVMGEEDQSESDTDTDRLTTGTSNTLPAPGPLRGYKYVPFEPLDMLRTLEGHIHTLPTMHDAISAMVDLQSIIRPKRKMGAGFRDPDLDLWTRARLEGMQSVLHMYTDRNSKTYDNWGASLYQAAIGMGCGCHCARRLQELC